MTRDACGMPLAPGYNADALNLHAGLAQAQILGYDDGRAIMVVTYALRRWARGEEEGAERTWVAYYPSDYTSWRIILAAALAGMKLPEWWVAWKGFGGKRAYYARRPNTTPAWVVWGRTMAEVTYKAMRMEDHWKRTGRYGM
jgi:hypothetical protein